SSRTGKIGISHTELPVARPQAWGLSTNMFYKFSIAIPAVVASSTPSQGPQGTRYFVKRDTPEWARRALLVAGGTNRFGDPNFRVVWGDSLFDWIGGNWEDRDESGNLIREVKQLRWAVKYPWLAHRWIVERWLPPEKFGTPETWARQTREWGQEGNIPQLGPYPSRGRYVFCSVL